MNFLEPILFSPVEKTLLFIMGIKKKKSLFFLEKQMKVKWKRALLDHASGKAAPWGKSLRDAMPAVRRQTAALSGTRQIPRYRGNCVTLHSHAFRSLFGYRMRVACSLHPSLRAGPGAPRSVPEGTLPSARTRSTRPTKNRALFTLGCFQDGCFFVSRISHCVDILLKSIIYVLTKYTKLIHHSY